jgi:Ca-activated chloride channel homolog
VLFRSLSLVKDAIGRGPGMRRHIPAILFLFSIAVLIVSLARPQAQILLPGRSGTIILALDVSGSMRAQDVKPNRLDAAKAAAKSFIDKQPRTVRIGLVIFSGTAALVQPPTTVKEDMVAALNRLFPQRGTAIGSGLLTSLNAVLEDEGLQPPPNPEDPQSSASQPLQSQQPAQDTPPAVPPGSNKTAAIVLLSDGQSNQGPDPLDIADQVANWGIRVFTVGVGTTGGAIVGWYGRSFRVELDEPTLKAIANKTGGSYFKATDENQLLKVYQDLSTKLIVERQKTELTALFAAIAAGALLVAGALSLAWFNRLP